MKAKQSSLKSPETGCGCPVVTHPANECRAKLLFGWKSLGKCLSPVPEQLG